MSRYQFPGGGSTTTDASLLVSGTLADARLSSNVALENVANVFTQLLSFSGTDTPGLQLKSLTTAQITALGAIGNGSILIDSTTNRVDVRLNGVTQELIDTRGGQTINGNLTASGTINVGGSGVATPTAYGGVTIYSRQTGSSAAAWRGRIVAGGDTVAFLMGEYNSQAWLGGHNAALNAWTALRINPAGTSDLYLGNNGADGAAPILTIANNGGASTFSGSVTTGNLTTGSVSASGTVAIPVGAAGTPSLTFLGNTSTGFFQPAANFISAVTAGTIRAVVGSVGNGANFGVTTCIGLSSDIGATGPDVNLARVSSGVARLGTTSSLSDGTLQLANLTASGTVQIGGGTVVTKILSATATLDFPSIGSNGTETLTITVTGAVAGDSVFLGVPAALDAGLVFCASVTAADTVTVRMHNSSGGSIDPASATFRATVIRF